MLTNFPQNSKSQSTIEIFSNGRDNKTEFDDFLPFLIWNKIWLECFFRDADWSYPFFKVLHYFLWREQLQSAIHFFKCTGFFWRINLSHPFFHVEWFISGNSWSRVFFQRLYETADFRHQLLSKSSHFFGREFLFISFFKGICWFSDPNYYHPSFGVRYLFL